MITEDYCSFETAKLLKEKGFDEECIGFYTCTEKPYFMEASYRNNWTYEKHGSINAPTHQMALKWLREVHKLFVKVNYTTHPITKDKNYYGTVINMEDVRETVLAFEDALTYEGCVNSLLKYALEKLI